MRAPRQGHLQQQHQVDGADKQQGWVSTNSASNAASDICGKKRAEKAGGHTIILPTHALAYSRLTLAKHIFQ
jgi:hypothetical protein